MFENPWKQDKIDKQGEEYIKKYKGESDKDFSWILDGDKEAIESVYDDNNNKDKQSIDWGLPNQVVGDPDTATFFLCLLNPRVQDADSSYDDFKGYVDKESADKEPMENSDEYSNDKEFYYQHIIHNEENELSKEIRKMKEKGDFIEQLSEFQNKVDKRKSVIKSIANKKEKDAKQKELTKYKKMNDPLRLQYYLHSYYSPILRQNSEEKDKDVQVNLYNNAKSVDFLNKLKICDLELFPYRTENKPKVNFTKLESSRYVASLIIERIVNRKDDEQLVFFFRSYNDWSKVILEVLKDKTGFKGDELKKKYNSLADYFYVGSSTQSMAISKNNIRKAPKQIMSNEYKNISNMFKYEKREK